MRKTIYVCDHCGKDMNSPAFTVSFKSNSLAVQEPGEWHYCHNCWGQVRTFLSTSKDNITWVKINDDYVSFYKQECYIKDINKDSLDYKQTTISTSGEKTIQAKPVDDELFKVTVRHCYENTNEDSLDYKQTVGMI